MGCREVEAGMASHLAFGEGHLHFVLSRGALATQNPDPRSCFDKTQVKCGPFSGSQLIHRFFLLMKLPCSLNSFSIWRCGRWVDRQRDLEKGRGEPSQQQDEPLSAEGPLKGSTSPPCSPHVEVCLPFVESARQRSEVGRLTDSNSKSSSPLLSPVTLVQFFITLDPQRRPPPCKIVLSLQ